MDCSWRSAKWSRADAIAVILIGCYAALYMVQVGLFPGARYPNWDAFWVDVRTMAGLAALRDALLQGQLPLLNPYDGLGFDLGGNHHSPLGIFNLLVLALKPANVMIVTQYLVLAISGIYSFLYLRLFSKNIALCLLGALMYVSLPIVTSRYYYDQTLFGFLFISVFLFHAHCFIETAAVRRRSLHAALLAFWGFCCIGSADIFFLETLPATVFFYVFVMAKFHSNRPLASSFGIALAVALLCLIPGSYYIALLLESLVQNAVSAQVFVHAGLLPKVPKFVPHFFSFMFWNYAAKSLILPIQGAGAFLYVPLVFYFILIMSLFLAFRQRALSKRNTIASLGLIIAAFWPFVFMMIFYSETFHNVFSAVAAAATAMIRHLWNIWPFLITLATFIMADTLGTNKQSIDRTTRSMIIAAIAATAVEYALFFILNGYISDNLYMISHRNYTGFAPANMVSLLPLGDPWALLPLINFSIAFVLVFSLACDNEQFISRPPPIFFILALILSSAFLFVTVQNDLRLYQGDWQLSTANNYRYRTYLERNACIDAAINRANPNYRTLVSSAPEFGNTGRNWKLIAETELNTAQQQKTLYSWREMVDPYVAATLGLFTGSFSRMVKWPPTTDEVLAHFDVLSLLGVRWLISADQSINDPRLMFRARCTSPPGPMEHFSKEKEGGALFVYEVRDPKPIAWLARKVEVANAESSVHKIFVDHQKPWMRGIALVDHLPNGYGSSAAPDSSAFAKIAKQTYLTMRISTESKQSRILVVSYAKRKDWLAYVDGKRTPILNVYGGLMGVPVPSGKHEVTFVYRSHWLMWGAILSVLAIIGPLFFWIVVHLLNWRAIKKHPASIFKN